VSVVSGPERQHQIVRDIVSLLEDEPSVEGAFLSGSLVNEHEDRFSDVDLGIASGDSAQALKEAHALRHRLLDVAGQPVHWIERGWEHCELIAALYGRSQFPPVGLEVDLVFSQLRHVGEQMPYATCRVLLDRQGRLAPALAQVGGIRPDLEVAGELEGHLRSYPFCVHDALKACLRGDTFQAQSRLEEMRRLFFRRCGPTRAAGVRFQAGLPVFVSRRETAR
jgi:predicted nucleotidyltransferase